MTGRNSMCGGIGSAAGLWALAGALSLLGAAGGCENMNGGKQAKKPADAAFIKPTGEVAGKPASRPAPARAQDLRDEMNQAAVDTQAAFDILNAKAAGQTPEKDAAGESPRMRPQSRGGKAGRSEPLPSLSLEDVNQPTAAPATQTTANPPAANRPASVSDPTISTHVADRTPEQRRADAVVELSQQLKPDIAAARQPLRAAMPLFGLESISPGAGRDGLDAVRAAVSPDQRRAIAAAEDLFKLFTLDPNLAAGDPGAVANAMRAQADQLVGQPQTDGLDLSLGTVSLCQQVDGFGRYTPLRSNAFIAGRTGSMVLYSEVEHFAQTPKELEGEEGSRWTVELGQSVKLFFDADGSEQMAIPETVVKDVSRAKRHDFFLVQRIDLPRTLSVGNYTLKVTVRDVANGAVVEQLTPIRVVADSSVVRDRTPSSGKGRPSGSERVTDRRP